MVLAVSFGLVRESGLFDRRLKRIITRINKYIITFAFTNVGMSELVKVRPENPVEWLASYLVKNDPQKAGAPGPAK